MYMYVLVHCYGLLVPRYNSLYVYIVNVAVSVEIHVCTILSQQELAVMSMHECLSVMCMLHIM